MQRKKAIVHLKFKTRFSFDNVVKVTQERREILKNTKGLISLFCFSNDETKTIGGTMIFDNIELAHHYLGRFMTEGLGPKYGIIPMTLKIEVSTITDEIQGINCS
ncbi:hypothetical protein [Aquimarina sp. MMG016]|uniref:hypothetical protein n=1 Tax=Aquimarina sp. MMG016 TaxID=2822690 RepID=UPI001B3A05CE|nr:hypothetical protein [Aquimarina sp. MMG016]MBQ4820560.1 hypothetical protein [Aquimarina sp. MMG016]